MHECRTLSVSIGRDPAAVYEFVVNPANLSLWASGLGDAGAVRFAERNPFGVLDHHVTVEPGVEVYAPMRVIANGEGSELLFTLFRQPEMSAEKFEEDAAWVKSDLEALKRVLEAGS